jgi:hypothetical protein
MQIMQVIQGPCHATSSFVCLDHGTRSPAFMNRIYLTRISEWVLRLSITTILFHPCYCLTVALHSLSPLENRFKTLKLVHAG